MHPILFSIGPFHFRAYGLALATAFLLGSWLALRRGRERGFREDALFGLFGWILVSALVGARLHFVLGHPEDFPSPLDALRIWEGGMTLYGGLLAAILASWVYVLRHRIPFLPVADLVAPSIALGEALTRIGCFVNGCCFGRPCEGALCVHYPADSYAAAALGPNVPVFPSQLLLSALFFLATPLLLYAGRKLRGAGAILGLYLVLQGLARWAVDWTRFYEPVDRVTWAAPLVTTKSQFVALFLFAWGVVLLVRARRAPVATPAGKNP
jgi:phosphatidylglycerol:prolipoprotein diacylglycerol transferase